jgi:YidC/Oxa1 family membrane protein insertase
MAAQLPVFISLYYMLRQSLRADVCPAVQPHHLVNGISKLTMAVTNPCGPHNGAGFLFIGDLTNRATGVTLVVLIVLYVGSQIASTYLMSMYTPTMDPTQRRLMMVLPLMFVLFILQFPAGVIVYWITTNTWTMAQQYVLRRRMGQSPTVAAAAANGGGSGPGGGLGALLSGGGGDGNGSGSGSGGLGSLLRGRAKAESADGGAVATKSRTERAATPPPPPRKKKKRSGRRR